MLHLPPGQIGGAKVRKRLTVRGVEYLAGAYLTGDQVRAMPIANRRALVEQQVLETWPVAPASSRAPEEKFVRSLGLGKFDVIEGRRVNSEPLTRSEADALAAL